MDSLKIFLLSSALVLVLMSGFVVFAQEEVALDEDIQPKDLGVGEPRLLPDSPFYFLKEWQRSIGNFFTFNPVKKAERYLQQANEKLIEAERLAEKTGKGQIVVKATEKYQKAMEKAGEEVEKIKEKQKDNPEFQRLMDKFADNGFKQNSIMEDLRESLQNASPDIRQKIEINQKGAVSKWTETLVNVDGEKVSERFDRVTPEIKGDTIRHLELLKQVQTKLEENLPEKARAAEVLENVIQKQTDRIEQRIQNIQESEQVELFKKRIESAAEEIKTEILKRKPNLLQKIEERKDEIIKCANENEFCGGIAGIKCCGNLMCELEGNYPDAGGKCVKAEIDCAKAEERVNRNPLAGSTGRKCCPGLTENRVSKSYSICQKPDEETCKDLCGDGTCQEIVCQAVGCPCAETSETCPQDCVKECADEYEYFSTVYNKYPDHCCEGLTEWSSGMDSRISIADKCYETGLVKGSPVGTCINCGDGFCRSIETPCNCSIDCVGKGKSTYNTIEEFCEKGYPRYCAATLSSVQTGKLALCQLCQIICRNEDYPCYVGGDLACCEGLKEVPLAYEDSNGECVAATCGSICRPCGNEICDENENKCNCPDDCQSEKDILKIDIKQEETYAELTVSAKNCPNEIDALGFDVRFEGEAEYLSFSRGDLIKDFEFFDTNDLGNNTIRVGGFTTKGKIPKDASGNMVILKFEGQVNSAIIINLKDDVAI